MDKILDEYYEEFNEDFPIMLFMGTPEDEIIDMIKDCLEKGEPYDPDYYNDDRVF